MNENTLISVHCYGPTEGLRESWDLNPDGDVERVRNLMPVHEQHQAPIVILSPVDAPVKAMGPHICRSAGRRGYIGKDSLDRQIEHFKILLGFPFDYFLLNDSDSCCISARIPSILYDRHALRIWSSEIVEPRPHASPYPKLAFHPPYFLNRKSMSAIVEVAPRIEVNQITPYIDWAMCAWSCEAGLEHRSFLDLDEPPSTTNHVDENVEGKYSRIWNGAVMIHPVKSRESRDWCLAARKEYEAR